MDLKLNQQERWLTHYTRAETAFRWIVPSEQIRLSPYSEMRDPMENKRLFFTAGGGWGGEEVDRDFFATSEVLSRARDRYRIASFTQASTTDAREWALPWLLAAPWARPRMWEQYGDNHQGVCLVIDKALLLDELPDKFKTNAVTYTAGGYAGTVGARGLSNLGNLGPGGAEAAVAEHVTANFDDFFFVKSDDWAAEHEFRVITEAPGADVSATQPEHEFLPIGHALRCVILGERFPNWQIPAARAAIDGEAAVELRRMSWTLGKAWPGTKLENSVG